MRQQASLHEMGQRRPSIAIRVRPDYEVLSAGSASNCTIGRDGGLSEGAPLAAGPATSPSSAAALLLLAAALLLLKEYSQRNESVVERWPNKEHKLEMKSKWIDRD